MPLPPDYQKMDSTSLLMAFQQASGELGILMVSDAPIEELNSAQTTCDEITGELMRMMAWAQVETPDTPVARKFVLVPTGAEVPAMYTYLQTLFLEMGTVFHVYVSPVVLGDHVGPVDSTIENC